MAQIAATFRRPAMEACRKDVAARSGRGIAVDASETVPPPGRIRPHSARRWHPPAGPAGPHPWCGYRAGDVATCRQPARACPGAATAITPTGSCRVLISPLRSIAPAHRTGRSMHMAVNRRCRGGGLPLRPECRSHAPGSPAGDRLPTRSAWRGQKPARPTPRARELLQPGHIKIVPQERSRPDWLRRSALNGHRRSLRDDASL